MSLEKALKTASEIYAEHYADATVVLLAGSVVRGEATQHSDLDLIIVYDLLDQARRESFFHDGWPVEAFIHDPKTLDYFFRKVDRPSGVPSLPDMVADGVEVSQPNKTTTEIKTLARTILDEGPPVWTDVDRNNSRYAITDLVDDIRSPRSVHELHATLMYLYPAMANHYFRSRGIWAAKGKSIPRKLAAIAPEFAKRFSSAFDAALTTADTDQIIQLSADLLEPDGGFHFDGNSRLAPKNWRSS
ncbi:nucleotidyltransferase domain-containing protein [uncultured Roseobacter sp.]|uniref:nucleotidyltransferase domain-containing protein n=1 Tax=uncultured Roseobacter sp. TaxID=114847 RepID=UPI002611544A|nr:nucleotidyltransferase domain-containing protein [uncultured Roseobacter sp.]